VERFVALVGNISNVRPDVLDRVDWDSIVKHYADILGVKPEIILTDEVVAKIRAAKQAREQQQMALQQQLADAKAAHDLAGSSLEGDNVLGRMANQMAGGPVGGAQA
jgi:hypothetical protein